MYININTVEEKQAVSFASKEGSAGVNAERKHSVFLGVIQHIVQN
jgi:hypothetical protein